METPATPLGNNRVDMRQQAVTGVVPPQLGEARIRQTWPSVVAYPFPARLGRMLLSSRIGAPLAWLLLAPLYFKKILPFLATRYTVTNRRVMIQRGLKPKPVQEVALADIDDVRIQKDDNSAFYLAATLEILSKGQVVLTLPGVPEPESFRHTILNACKAWAPPKDLPGFKFVPASAETAK
jgi:hypothetical protein